MSTDPNQQHPKPGEVLAGKYVVERVVGAGGMGVVVAARHEELDRRVALKFLLPAAARAGDAKARFLREARAAVGLKSEHVARVLDVGTLESGAPYIVMEYLEGSDLRDLVERRGPLPTEEAVDYVLQAAEAVAEAHALGIVHRDLKPANLFVTARNDGTAMVKVLDFGISKVLQTTASADHGLTGTDVVMGSPSYMSPEQIRSAKHVDTRTDIWALGVVLYELLTATPPFDGDNVATLSAQICMDAAAPIEAPGVPEGLSAVVMRCLEKAPEARYQNLAELAVALAPFAPDSSRHLAQRIARLSPVGSHDITLPASAAARAAIERPSATADTVAATASTLPAHSTTGSRVWMAIASVAVVIAVTSVALIVSMTSRQPADASSVVESAPAIASPAPSHALAAPVIAAAPSASVAHAAPAASGSSMPSPPAPRAASVKSPPAAKCGAGQVLSQGHCCPIGMVWGKSGCERPLAKEVPF